MRYLLKLPAAAVLAAAFAPVAGNAAAGHTVPWYIANADGRMAMITACKADPGDLASTPDCINAREAESEVFLSTP